MREDIKQWVDALRSGEYEQGKGALEFDRKFCCLGVYCKVMGIRYKPVNESSLEFHAEEGEKNSRTYKKLRSIIDPNIIDRGIFMNDDGYHFNDIADMIERHYREEGHD